MAETRRLSELRELVTERLTLPTGPLVVALSGGADSAALAYLVSGARARAIHVDHGLPASSLMRAAAETIAGQLDMEMSVAEVVLGTGPSPEAQARHARYEALIEAVRADEAVLTAHTADDNLETILINLVRGTGTRGLAGIPRFRPPNIHRPLLEVRRGELREIAYLVGLPFVDDPMNLDPGLTRNRVRSRVVPRLREINPAVEEAIGRMSLSLRGDADHLDQEAAGHRPSLGEGRATMPAGVLRALPAAISNRVIMTMLRHVMGGAAGVGMGKVDLVRSVADGAIEHAEIGGHLSVWRSGSSVVLGTREEAEDLPVSLGPGLNHFGEIRLEVTRHDGVCQVAPLSLWNALFPLHTELTWDGVVRANGVPAWDPGVARHPVAWYPPGEVGYLSVFATWDKAWKSGH
jgi:tRNA(Ile)-lysidine synthase